MHRARGVIFNDEGGRGGLGTSDFCDKGGGGSSIPQILMTSLKESPLSVSHPFPMLI